jgi:hypothetical protein
MRTTFALLTNSARKRSTSPHDGGITSARADSKFLDLPSSKQAIINYYIIHGLDALPLVLYGAHGVLAGKLGSDLPSNGCFFGFAYKHNAQRDR